jgi:hypothetical protein
VEKSAHFTIQKLKRPSFNVKRILGSWLVTKTIKFIFAYPISAGSFHSSDCLFKFSNEWRAKNEVTITSIKLQKQAGNAASGLGIEPQ